MGIIKKYKREILAAICLVIFYFISRLVFITNFPIFTDEAIYVRWSQIASGDAAWRFISLTDGKQPSLIWAGMILVKLINDPLLALRLVSVVSGFFTLVGIWFLTYQLFKDRWVAFISSLFYIVYPFAVVYDRLALYDSILTAFTVWAIYFSLLLVKKIRLDIALILGIVLGGGLLTKSSAIFSVYLLPVTVLLFDFKKKDWKVRFIKWAALAILAALISQVIYNALRLSPFFHIIGEKNTIFVYPFNEWIMHPFTFLAGNLKGLTNWLFTYLTPFYVLLITISLLSIKKFPKEKLLLVAYFILPFLALALFGRVIFPRFIFFMSISLLPLASLGLMQIITVADKFFEKRKINAGYVISALVIVFFLLYPLKVSSDFIFNPQQAAIADADKSQYISEWPAGGGVVESIEFFKEEAKKGPIFIGTEGTFGLMPASLDIYLGKNPNIKTNGYWPINDEIPEDVLEYSKKMPTFFIFYQPCPSCEFSGDAPDSWPLDLVKRIRKSDKVYYSIYKVGD